MTIFQRYTKGKKRRVKQSAIKNHVQLGLKRAALSAKHSFLMFFFFFTTLPLGLNVGSRSSPYFKWPFSVGTTLIFNVHQVPYGWKGISTRERGVCKGCVNTLRTVVSTETLQVSAVPFAGFIKLFIFHSTSITNTANKDGNQFRLQSNNKHNTALQLTYESTVWSCFIYYGNSRSVIIPSKLHLNFSPYSGTSAKEGKERRKCVEQKCSAGILNLGDII